MSEVAKQIALFVGSSESLSPALKWAGGKRWLVPQLKLIFRKHQARRLVEPFAGGLAVALGLAPKKALLNDSNPHLINFYKCLKKGLIIDQPLRNERGFFFQERERFNKLILDNNSKTAEAAALFYYLNRTCFNGLCRFNSSGLYNVPFGKYKNINYTTDFTPYMRAFKGWRFSNSDFEKLKISDSDFLYIDPPYDVEFTRYAKDDFTWEDQRRLAAWLGKIKAPIVASNQATDRVVKLYKDIGFSVSLIKAPRMIACNGDRKPALEILATKNI